MRVEPNTAAFFARIEDAFSEALEDAATFARNQDGSPSDTRAERLGPLHGRVGSSREYARAQERGAYIRSRYGKGRRAVLKFHDGRVRRWSRLPARRYLAKTGAQWGDLLLARLRQAGL
jgi:hypothetical protein